MAVNADYSDTEDPLSDGCACLSEVISVKYIAARPYNARKRNVRGIISRHQ